MLNIHQIVSYLPEDIDDNVTRSVISYDDISYSDLDNIISIYTDKHFSRGQIKEINDSLLRDKIPLDKVILIASPNNKTMKMKVIHDIIMLECIGVRDIEDLLRWSPDYSQTYEIYLGLKHGLSLDKIFIYSDSAYDSSQMRTIRCALESGMQDDKLAFVANAKYPFISMDVIANLIYYVPIDRMNRYVSPNYNFSQISEIMYGLKDNLSDTQMELFTSESFDWSQMRAIREGVKCGLRISSIRLYANPLLDSSIMRELKNAINIGADDNLIKDIISRGLTCEEIHEITERM